MNLPELQREAHAIARAHGWYDTERTFADFIALVHSELSEALEAYREWELVPHVHCWQGARYDVHPADQIHPENHSGTKPIGVPSELADVVIRVADMAEWYGVDLASLNEGLWLPRPLKERSSFGEWIAALHYLVSMALYWHEDMGITATARGSWEQCLQYVLSGVQHMADHYGIDLDAAIEAKLECMRR